MKKLCHSLIKFLKGDSIDLCLNEVHERNYNNINSFSILGILMMIFTVVFGQMMNRIVTFNREFLILLLYMVLIFITVKAFPNFKKRSTGMFYVLLTPVMIMGILLGTFFDPNEPSITIMVFMCVLPLFILDKPWRIVLYISLTAVVYSICCYLSKNIVLFAADMIDLMLFYVMAVGVNCIILRDRIDNVQHALQMKALSEIDVLTGILNRKAGEEKIKQLLKDEATGTLYIMDIDCFKQINDNFGHTFGDKVLQEVTKVLIELKNDNIVIMRLGGDEFIMYEIGESSKDSKVKFCNNLFENISKLHFTDYPQCNVTISMGGTYSFTKEIDFENVYRNADSALY